MNNTQTEIKSINALKCSILKSGRLVPYITENDKTPSLDGKVIVYRDSSLKKDKIIGEAPVQVKGKVCDDLPKSQISFSMDIADLKNYYNNGGCVLFVVYIAKDSQKTKIYYNALTPVRLERLLKDTKQGQKEKSVKLTEFPPETEKIESIFDYCVQTFVYVPRGSILSLGDLDNYQKNGLLEELYIEPACPPLQFYNDPVGALLNSNDASMYAKTKGSKALQLVNFDREWVTHMWAWPIGRKTCKIGIDGKIYAMGTVTRSKKRENNEKIVFQFLDGIVLEVDADEIRKGMRSPKCVCQLNMPERIYMVVYRLEFLLTALKKGYFSVTGDKGEELFKVKAPKSVWDRQKLEEELRYFKRVKELFEMLHCADDANINDMKGEDWKRLDLLMEGLLDKKPVKGDLKDDSKKDLRYIRTYYEVGKLKFLIGLEKCSEKGEYKIYDFFSPDFQLPFCVLDDECPEKTVPIPRCVCLQENDLLTLSNIDFGGLIKDWKDKVSDRVDFGGERNFAFLGRLLNACDKASGSRKEKLLKVCKELVDWMNEPLDYELNEEDKQFKTLHTCEIIKRYRDFTEEERKELWSIALSKKAEPCVITIAYWLLGEQELAKEEFEKLSKEDQEILKNNLSF